jgi:hypothetical protein
MTGKNRTLITVALGLAIVYACFVSDWFKPKTIQIHYSTRSPAPARRPRPGAAANADAEPPTFGFDRECQFTEIKVVPLAALQTSKLAQPVWHLVSNSGSIPTSQFFYGENVNGMNPAVPGARAEPLQVNVTYRLFVAAGRAKGQHDFQARPSAGR